MKKLTTLLFLLSGLWFAGCSDTLAPSDTTSKIPNLVAWYKLDQNTADSSGNKHDGTAQGGKYVPDRFGNAQSAFETDGTSFISVPHADDLNFDSLASFSISVWVKTSSTSQNYIGILSKGPSFGSVIGYAIGLNKGLADVQFSGSLNTEIRGTTPIADNKWHMITITVAANIAAALYVDGYPEAGTTPIQYFPSRNNQASLFLGKDRTSTSFFTGDLDDIYLYAKLLTPNEVGILFHERGYNGVIDTTTPPDTTISSGGYGSNLLSNSGFSNSLSSSEHMDGSNCAPWNVAYGQPFTGAGLGADGVTHGYLYMWGTADDGCAVYENLPTPIKKGHTYRIAVKIRFDHENTTPYTRVRFLAFNDFGFGVPWQTSSGSIASLGSITVSKIGSYDAYTTTDWTADADYDKLEIDCQNDNSGQGAESWARIDDVQLQEKK